MYDFTEPDPEDAAAMTEQFQLLEQRAASADDDLRRIGVHVRDRQRMQLPTPFGMKPALVLVATAGKLAFSERTLDPEADVMDREFRRIVATDRVDGYLDAQSEIRSALDEGRDPWA